MIGLEHWDVFPAASVAVARKFVLVSLRPLTAMPGEANVAAVPVAVGVPEQSELV